MKTYRVDVDEDGNKWWYLNNKLNRHDGPSVEYACGHKEYWINDQLHRLDGPAVEYVDGTKEYWVNGVLHRLDGPAIEWNTGEKFYYINGVALTENQFNDTTTVKNNNGKIIEIDGIKYKLTKI